MGIRLQHRRIFLSGAALIALSAGPAWAQQDAPPATEPPAVDSSGNAGTSGDIVVTGIRRSLQTAAQAKRSAAVVSDVISSEDIGKFPDQNLAESLQRVTGVQITRNKGEGSLISVRGLSPDFTRTQYNGRTMPTPTGGRSFAFTSLGSDFVSSVEVLKSPTADLIEGGLSATVNVQVARPLDVGRNREAFTAEGIYESNPRKLTPHIAGFVNHVFADGDFGVNLGVDYERRRVVQAGFVGYGVETRAESANANPPLDYDRDGRLASTVKFDHANTFDADEGSFTRLNIVGGFQAKPIDGLNLYGDGFYSEFNDNYTRYEHQLRFTNIAGAGAAIRGSTIDSTGLLTSLDADGVDHRGDNRRNRVKDTLASGAIGGSYKIGRLTLSAEGTLSYAKRTTDLIAFAMISRASASYDIRNGFDKVPVNGFDRGYNPLDASTFHLLNVNGVDGAYNDNRNYDGRFDATYTFDGLLKSLKAGFYASNMRTSFHSANFNIPASALATALGLPYDATIEGGSVSAAGLLETIDRQRYLKGPLGTYLVPDYGKVFGKTSFAALLAQNPVIPQPARDYAVTERGLAGYVRADFATTDDAIAGNVGVRYVDTRQTSSGASPDLTQAYVLRGGIQTIIPSATPISIKNHYSYWLPNINARWNATDKLVVRAAAARTLTRPDLGLLSPASSIDANVRTINSGNPNLRPYLADQVDLSLEYYPGHGALISVAGFYKSIKNFVLNTSTVRTVTLRREEGGTLTQDYRVFQPNNGADGKIKGIEAGVQLPLYFLPGLLDGFGLVSNFTYLDVNNVQTAQNGPRLPLPGVSKRSYNLGGYYEKDGFGVRVSYNYRSKFVNDALSYFGDGDFTKAYGQLDLSSSYDFNKHVSVSFDVTNLNNAMVTTVNGANVLRTMLNVGRRFTGGVRLKF